MISSTSNPKVKQVVQWQTKAKERKSAGVFLTEGFKLFEEAPEDCIREVYVSESALGKLDKQSPLCRKLDEVGYELVTDDVLLKMSDTQTPQGILCVLKRPEYTLEQLLEKQNPLFVMLEDVQDPGNLGTIMRTGEGAGITGVIMTKQTVDLFNPKTIRATMGSIFRVPYLYVDDLKPVMAKMHEKGIHTYAAHLKGETFYDSFSFREGTAFLIGNEGNGLRKETADYSEKYLKIPMEGQLESLNAAVSAALLMYEAHRQRS